MGSRVLRRLREEKEELERKPAALKNDDDAGDGTDSDYSFLEDDDVSPKHSKAFLLMMDDSSDDDDDDDDNSNRADDDYSGGGGNSLIENIEAKEERRNDIKVRESDEKEEDLDAILSEFQCQDLRAANNADNLPPDSSSLLFHSNFLIAGIDSREFDLDFSLRSMLGGSAGGAGAGAGAGDARVGAGIGGARGGLQQQQQSSSRKTYRKCLFVQPLGEWGRRPPSFVGGGMGMKLLGNLNAVANTDETTGKCVDVTKGDGVPWPYSEDTPYRLVHPEYQAWYSFERSSTYSAKINEYVSYISNTGDINALAMYTADNPFLVEPLLQLATFFFCTNENERGMDLLKRVLWVFESACVTGFLPPMVSGSAAGSTDGEKGKTTTERHRVVVNLMDKERDENSVFFSALFRLMQTSATMGCIGTSLAVGRFLLSLDPMRDPMGVLMLLDYFALTTMKDEDLDFIVNLVESKTVQIYCKDVHTPADGNHCCELTDMPNWAYSYPLALYRQSVRATEVTAREQLLEKANRQLHNSICAFPEMPSLILEKNNVDATGRSFSMDWPLVLEPLRKSASERVCGMEAEASDKYEAVVDRIGRIFVGRGHKLWSGDDVLKWLYNGCKCVTVTASPEAPDQDVNQPKTSTSSALTRYLQFNPADFESTLHTLPADIAMF